MLGSGPIAVPVLEKLYAQSQAGLLDLVGVGTQPDRPAGRKRQLMPTPVGAFAAEKRRFFMQLFLFVHSYGALGHTCD